MVTFLFEHLSWISICGSYIDFPFEINILNFEKLNQLKLYKEDLMCLKKKKNKHAGDISMLLG
jgi:hypothetical protein